MDFSSLLGSNAGTVQPQGYILSDGTMVRPAMAVDPSAAGQSFGGQGMAMPQGANSLASGKGYASTLSNLLGGIGDSASQFVKAGAKQTALNPPPQGFQPVLAQFPFAPVDTAQPVLLG